MRRYLAFMLAVFAPIASLSEHASAADRAQANTMTSGGAPAGQYYCPPGAKFCPAPGTNNTVFLDTHFGMDAQTGEVVAYTGNVHPDDVYNPPMTGETVLYTSPPISVENRYVPYPGAPQTNMAATTANIYAAPPSPAAAPFRYDANPGPAQARPTRRADAQSEVAYNQTSRPPAAVPASQEGGDGIPWWKGGLWRKDPSETNSRRSYDYDEDDFTNGERVPWWKGGMWRNRKDDGDDGGSRPSGSPGALRASDDMWGDDEYDGYNPDGSVGRAGGDPYAAPNFGGQQQQYDPYATAYAGGGNQIQAPVYTGDAYTLPNSPPPTSPYQPGYVYPGSDVSYENTYQGGYGQPQPAPVPVSYSGGSSLPPPPMQQSYSPPAAPAASTPQFENAVRLVKENRFSEAKGMLASETAANPGNSAAWRWLGDCHYNLLELDDAINCYQRALDRDPNDYYALRGQGFSYLHRGHEYWRRMQEEVSRGQKEQAANTFSQAHDNYKKSLELLGLCLRRAPNDGEAIYGEAMAAEGASRKLYSNAISYLKLNDQRERAELFAENCLTVINKGVERAKERSNMNPGESGPRALLGGLYLRKAILYHQLGKNDLALMELRNSRDVQQSILDEIDKNNATALKGVRECETYWQQWGGGSRAM